MRAMQRAQEKTAEMFASELDAVCDSECCCPSHCQNDSLLLPVSHADPDSECRAVAHPLCLDQHLSNWSRRHQVTCLQCPQCKGRLHGCAKPTTLSKLCNTVLEHGLCCLPRGHLGPCQRGSRSHEAAVAAAGRSHQRAVQSIDARTKEAKGRMDAFGTAPIHKIWAQKVGRGFVYHGKPKGSHWEKLENDWVEANFGLTAGYSTFLESLRGGKALVVPVGRAATRSSTADPSPGSQNDTGASCPTGVLLPGGVIYQGVSQHCASYGLASALAACGFVAEAESLVSQADKILACTTNQAKKAVDTLVACGGWARPQVLDCSIFDPLVHRSPLPTIVQLCASDADNTHVVGIAGDYLYDSNFTERRLLTREALDASCIGEATFARASYAARLTPGKKLCKKRARE